jgi:rhodanese-related sulfurtransferase
VLVAWKTDAMARTTIDDLLADARARLTRLGPQEAHAAMQADALLIDIRSESQRAADGVVPGSVWFARNVLEWRCDPVSEGHDARIADLGQQLIVMCDEGYQSSLAAATLQQLGFARATDLAGGFRAWRALGLPVQAPAADAPGPA